MSKLNDSIHEHFFKVLDSYLESPFPLGKLVNHLEASYAVIDGESLFKSKLFSIIDDLEQLNAYKIHSKENITEKEYLYIKKLVEDLLAFNKG
jgi:hypothetical protein